MPSKAVNHLANIGVDDYWETPLDKLLKFCVNHDVNPVMDAMATEQNKKFPLFIDEQTDFMTQDISVDFFINPKYSQKGWHRIRCKRCKFVISEWYEKYGIDDFIRHAYELHKKHNVTVLALTFAKTDTAWFNTYVYDEKNEQWIAEFYPIRSRIKFEKNGVPGDNSSPYPSCWIIWRKKVSSDSSTRSNSVS